MPVFGYIAIPIQGEKEVLAAQLASLPHCQIIPADNRDILVLVTDTPDEQTEKELQQKLQRLESLQSLSMTFGHTE